jgi:beta-N-acetylhexosaminidase
MEKRELVPFKRLIDAKMASIMVGHITLPFLTGNDEPASISEVVDAKLLRGELVYEGVLVTDCRRWMQYRMSRREW